MANVSDGQRRYISPEHQHEFEIFLDQLHEQYISRINAIKAAGDPQGILDTAMRTSKIGLLDLHSFRNIGYFVGNGVLRMKKLFGGSAYDAAPLEKAIDTVVKASQIPDGGTAPLLDDTKPKM